MPDDVISMAVQLTGVDKAKADLKSIPAAAAQASMQMQAPQVGRNLPRAALHYQGPQYWQYMNQGMGDRWYISRQDAAERFARRQQALSRLTGMNPGWYERMGGLDGGGGGTGFTSRTIRNFTTFRGVLSSLTSGAAGAGFAVLGAASALGNLKKAADDFGKLSPREQLLQEMDEDMWGWAKRQAGSVASEAFKEISDAILFMTGNSNLMSPLSPMPGRSLREMMNGVAPLTEDQGEARQAELVQALKEMAPLSEDEMRRAVRDGMKEALGAVGPRGHYESESAYNLARANDELRSRGL